MILVFTAVALVVVCLLPCPVLAAVRHIQQEGYYVESIPQQQNYNSRLRND